MHGLGLQRLTGRLASAKRSVPGRPSLSQPHRPLPAKEAQYRCEATSVGSCSSQCFLGPGSHKVAHGRYSILLGQVKDQGHAALLSAEGNSHTCCALSGAYY